MNKVIPQHPQALALEVQTLGALALVPLAQDMLETMEEVEEVVTVAAERPA